MNTVYRVLTVGGCLWAGFQTSAWAQTTTTTGTFLGQKINPVMAVELDAAPVRALPPSTPALAPASATRAEPEGVKSLSAPMYTGLENLQNTRASMPAPSMDRLRDERR